MAKKPVMASANQSNQLGGLIDSGEASVIDLSRLFVITTPVRSHVTGNAITRKNGVRGEFAFLCS